MAAWDRIGRLVTVRYFIVYRCSKKRATKDNYNQLRDQLSGDEEDNLLGGNPRWWCCSCALFVVWPKAFVVVGVAVVGVVGEYDGLKGPPVVGDGC